MSVRLHRRADPPTAPYDYWIALDADPADMVGPVLPDAAQALERAFTQAAADWFALAKRRRHDPGAGLCHTLACIPNAEDMGLMLAWTRLVREWAGQDRVIAVLCDDPWLFRHLARLDGVVAGSPPPLIVRRLKSKLRGWLARGAAALRVLSHHLRLRKRRRTATGAAVLTVYGHPGSDGHGRDAYFGSLMTEFPALRRLLHTDCPYDRAVALDADGRTDSLHAWGNPFYALTLPFRYWRPFRPEDDPDFRLIQRAADREAGGGQPAMIAWQRHCQARWLRAASPALVAWPWENHAWERHMTEQARALGIAVLGYQHSVVGGQFNMNPATLDDLNALPDRIAVNGPSGREQLLDWGIPADKLADAGALRFPAPKQLCADPDGPVFMAVPFDRRVAAQMVEAARPLARSGHFRFLIKDHPLHPFQFQTEAGLERTEIPLDRQKNISVVVFAATTVGLEAALAGLPVLRFRPHGCMALDILPKLAQIPAVDADGLAAALANPPPAAVVSRDDVFGPADLAVWKDLLRQ